MNLLLEEDEQRKKLDGYIHEIVDSLKEMSNTGIKFTNPLLQKFANQFSNIFEKFMRRGLRQVNRSGNVETYNI